MSILSRKPVAVEQLAADLAAAEQTRSDVLAQAQADFEAARANVIEQGRERAAELRRLEAEARTEAERAESVVKDASTRA